MDTIIEDRQSVLANIREKITQYSITQDELFVSSSNITGPSHSNRQTLVTKLLYYVGGILLVVGVIFWISINWGSYADFSKVLILLGTSLTLLSSGYIIEKNYKTLNEFTAVLYILSSILLPGGIAYTYFYLTNYAEPRYPEYVILTIFILNFLVLTTISIKSKFSDIFLFFQLISLNVIYFTFAYIINKNPSSENYYAGIGLLLGIIWAFLAYYYETIRNWFYKLLSGVVSMILIGSFTLILGSINDVMTFALLMNIIISIFYLYVSIRFKSSLFLALATIFFIGSLLGFITDVFGDYTSWPVLVILSGFIVMICGYYSFKLQKQYIKNES